MQNAESVNKIIRSMDPDGQPEEPTFESYRKFEHDVVERFGQQAYNDYLNPTIFRTEEDLA